MKTLILYNVQSLIEVGFANGLYQKLKEEMETKGIQGEEKKGVETSVLSFDNGDELILSSLQSFVPQSPFDELYIPASSYELVKDLGTKKAQFKKTVIKQFIIDDGKVIVI